MTQNLNNNDYSYFWDDPFFYKRLGDDVAQTQSIKNEVIGAIWDQEQWNLKKKSVPTDPKLEAWREGPEDFAEIADVFAEKISAETLSTPKTDPFSKTDLVIFKDTFKGILPINGISKKMYIEICNLFKLILKGETKVQFALDSSIDFVRKISQAFAIMLTRTPGRALLKALVNGPCPITIEEGDIACVKGYSSPTSLQTIILPQHTQTIFGKNATNQKILIPDTVPTILFHELKHVLNHRLNEFLETPLGKILDPKYDNLDDRIVISGLDEDLHEKVRSWQINSTNDQFTEEVSLDEKYTNHCYDPINEQAFCASHGLPFREDHDGFSIPYDIKPGEITSTLLNFLSKNGFEPDYKRLLKKRYVAIQKKLEGIYESFFSYKATAAISILAAAALFQIMIP